MRNSRGKSRRYAYNARGALTEYVGADGRHFQFQYDARGTLQNVIKAQNAALIYRRDEPENLFGIKEAKFDGILQIQNIGYTNSSANSTDDPCLFGGDGFSFTDPLDTDLSYGIDPSAIQDPYSSCNDPFAGMGGFEDSGFGGDLGGAETCEQCRARQKHICASGWYDCLYSTASPGLVAALGCLATPPPIDALCAFIAGVIIGFGTMAACQNRYDGCIEAILDKCPQCNR